MKHIPLPSQIELKRLLSYCPETGYFTWLSPGFPARWAGKVAGCKASKNEPRSSNKRTYVKIVIGRKSYGAHRLAWLYMTGNDPSDSQVDHINGDRTDNRFSNLRIADHSQNLWNVGAKSTNKLGIKGIFVCRITGKYRAHLCVRGVKYKFSSYETLDEAIAAYEAVARKAQGQFFPS